MHERMTSWVEWLLHTSRELLRSSDRSRTKSAFEYIFDIFYHFSSLCTPADEPCAESCKWQADRQIASDTAFSGLSSFSPYEVGMRCGSDIFTR